MSNLLAVLSLTSATWYDWSIGNSATFSALCLGLHVALLFFANLLPAFGIDRE